MSLLQGVANPVAKKWQAEAEEDQVDYKSKARDFVKLYSFISHLVPRDYPRASGESLGRTFT